LSERTKYRIRGSSRLPAHRWESNSSSSAPLALLGLSRQPLLARTTWAGPAGTYAVRTSRDFCRTVPTVGSVSGSGASQGGRRARSTCNLRCLAGTIKGGRQTHSYQASTMTPNPFINRTRNSRLRRPTRAGYVQR
jgi:hypothetical protein